MIVCPNCKKEMPDGARFCDACGFRLDLVSDAVKPETPQYQPVQVAQPQPGYQQAGQQPSQPQGGVPYGYSQQPYGYPQQAAGYPQQTYPQQGSVPYGYPQQPNQQATQPAEKKKTKKKLGKNGKMAILIAAIAAAVLVIVFLLIKLLGDNHKSREAGLSDYVLYMGEDAELLLTKDANKFDPWEIDENFIASEMKDSYYAEDVTTAGREISPMYNVVGNDLIYITNIGEYGFDLYFRSLKKEDAEAVKIASDVRDYMMIKDGAALLYTVGGYYDGFSLYEYTLKTETKEKIASDCWNFLCSEDGSVIAFLNNESTLYVKSTGEDKVKVENDVEDLCYIAEDGSFVVYIKEDTLFSKNIKKDERTKIDVDVYAFIGLDDNGNYLYTKSEEEFVPYKNIVNDDMASKEDSLVEPVYPEYPNSADYSTDAAWDKALDDYDKAYEEYDKAYDLYWGRWDRDALRESMADTDEAGYEYAAYTLYRFNGTDKEKIAEDVISSFYTYNWSEDHSILSFITYGDADDWKLNMSELTSYYNLDWDISEKRDDNAMLCVLTQDGVKEVTEWSKCTNVRFLESDYLYYAADYITEDEYGYDVWNDMGTIYRYNIETGENELIVDEAYIYFILFNNHLLYMKDYKDGKGDAYVDGECTDFEVSEDWFYPYEDLDMLVFFTDVDEEHMTGTLKYYQGGEVIKVAEDAMLYNVAVTDSGSLYYLTDYSSKHYKGDLYRFANGSSTKVDEEVTMVIEPVLN